MAAQHNVEPHQRMWHQFVKLMAATTIGVVAVLVLMALFVL